MIRSEWEYNINTAILDHFSGPKSIFYSVNSIKPYLGVNLEGEYISIKFLWSINVSRLSPGKLHLKCDCPLILLWNLASAQSLCNGTCLILLNKTYCVLEVKILSGQYNGEVAFIPHISLILSTQPRMTFHLHHCQFPIHLTFALTINKTQRQSVWHIDTNPHKPVFLHGQLYVTLSHATSYKHIKILLLFTITEAHICNIVYPEIFQMLRSA